MDLYSDQCAAFVMTIKFQSRTVKAQPRWKFPMIKAITQTRRGPYSEFLVKVFNFFWGFFFHHTEFLLFVISKKDRQIFLNKKHVEDAIWFVYYFVCISNTKMIDLHSNSKSGNFKETKLWVRLNFMNRYSKLEFSLLILVKIICSRNFFERFYLLLLQFFQSMENGRIHF